MPNGIRQPFAPTVETVRDFLEDQGKCKAPATVQRRLYGIRKVYRVLRLTVPTYDEDIYLVMRKVRRARDRRPRQAKGLTRSYLERFLESEPDTPWGLRNRGMLAFSYK